MAGSHSAAPCCGAAVPCLLRLLLRHPVELARESRRPVAPLEAIGRQPGVQRVQRLGLQAVQPPLRVPPRRYETRLPQDTEVPRHRGLRHLQSVDQFSDRPLAGAQQVEDPAPIRLGERRHDLLHDDVYRQTRIYTQVSSAAKPAPLVCKRMAPSRLIARRGGVGGVASAGRRPAVHHVIASAGDPKCVARASAALAVAAHRVSLGQRYFDSQATLRGQPERSARGLPEDPVSAAEGPT